MRQEFVISNVATRIYDGVIGVEIYLEGLKTTQGKNYIVFDFDGIVERVPSIEVTELEILKGCKVGLVFDSKYETPRLPIFHDRFLEDGRTIRSVDFLLGMTLNELRVAHKALKKPFFYIEEAGKIWYKNKLLIKIRCAWHPTIPNPFNYEIVLYMPSKKIIDATGLEIWEVSLLRGSHINFTYFNFGEECPEIGIVRKENTIIKDIIIRVDGTIARSFEMAQNWRIKPKYVRPFDHSSHRYNNDDFINDALGGEADAAWNLD
jgi:hypothetical protein